MRRYFSANENWIAAAANVVPLLLVFLMTLTLPVALRAQDPALTTISDTVYRADGMTASGVALISWPSFQTADGEIVEAGNQSVTIGAGGEFVAQLTPNVGATPDGTIYTVVFQLDDGTVRSEYWAVPATSPTTIAAVRTTPGNGLGNTVATQQYVNAYVAAAVQNVGSGSYVSKAGDVMTGPLTLAGDPTAPQQAADRHYVDNALAAKADLVSGMIPTGQLGAGVASADNCLTGNSTWSACGGGAPAGMTYATTALNWSQAISNSLTGGSQATVTLTPCPAGIDTTSGAGYQVLLSGGGNSEAVNVMAVAGSCTSGAPSGTIKFTPFYSYPAGSMIGSASGGIQETLNVACGMDSVGYKNSQCNVTIPANGPNGSVNTYNIAGTIYLHSNQSVLSGYGTSLNCKGRGPCLQIGDLKSSNDYTNNTVLGLSFRSPVNLSSSPAFAGVTITQTQRASQVTSITTATPHGFRVGDMVTVMFTDNSAYWGDAMITAIPNATTFQYAHSGADIAVQSTPGVVALTYVAVLDNGMNTHLTDINYDKVGENGAFNQFFDLWDDENVTIDHFNNNAIPLNASANWTGSFVFSAGNQGAANQIAPVISLRDSTITANYSNGLTVYNSNGIYVENTVLQATGPWQVYSANSTGNYQGAYLKNIYSESGPQMNPLSPARSPFAGLGVAGLIAGASSGASNFAIAGSGGTSGYFPSGGNGGTAYSYFVVAKDTTAGTQTSPMQVLNYGSTGSDSITVRWPRVANGTDAMTYDVIRTATPAGVGAAYPYAGGCTGGSTTACGSVATNVAQCSGLVCSYTDNGGTVTVNYAVGQGSYAGNLIFWPGSIVTVNKSVTVDAEEGNVVGVGLSGNPAQIANQCTSNGTTSPGGYTNCRASMTSANNSVPNQAAMLMSDGSAAGGGMSLSKGRLNFSTTPLSTLQPHHIITLVDSQPALTRSTWGYRPAASASDTWIGTDVASGGVGLNLGQLAFGAPVSITNYIAATGDGVHPNWLERLSGALKEFNVPVKFDQSVTIAGLANGCLNVSSGVIGSTGSACGSGGGGGSVTSVFGRVGAVTATAGDYSVAQVTGAAADASVVHNSGAETIGGAKTFSNTVTMSSNLLLPQGSGFVPAVGGIGLDTAAGVPVVNLGGTPHQIAFTSSNISGQAGTAVALAATPTQCSGSFATGIAANGNANCSTANVVQLAETAQPAGIPNWGVLWFDSATHTPRVIENNGQVTQLGMTNLFNSDPGGDPADNLEERNGTTAQNLRVYSTYSNNTTWQRTSLGFDAADGGWAVVRSENATAGSAPGLGLWVGSGKRWVVDGTYNFKPWSDNTYNIGSDSGNAAKSIFAKTSFNSVVYGRNDFEIPNDGTTGTVLNQLAVFTAASPSQAMTAAAGSTNVIGVVQGGAGKAGNAVVAWRGYAYCIFDNATVAGHAVVASTTTAGDCHDTGSAGLPTSQLVGYVDVTNAVAGQTNGMRVGLQPASSGGGSVSSVFGRTGAVTAGAGDYTVAQITGAAADSAVVHLAGAETISGIKTFSGDVTLSGNLNVAGNINQTSASPTLWSGKKWAGTSATVPGGTDFSLGVGSDNTFKCQLSSGGSCLPAGAGVANSTAIPWMTFSHGGSNINFSTAANKAIFTGVILEFAKTTSQVSYNVSAVDNTSDLYDLGIYSGTSGGTCTLMAHTGATPGTSFSSSTGWKTTSWTSGSVTLSPGRYYLAYTTSCSSGCATLVGDTGGFTFAGSSGGANSNVSVASGGTLPATATCPADGYATTSAPNWAVN